MMNALTHKRQKRIPVIFHNIHSDTIKQAFFNVFKSYKELYSYPINIHQKRLGKTTMRAQPVIRFKNLINGKKRYKIEIGKYLKDTKIPLDTVPKEVLEGWFAHELAHVVDYERRSNWGMVVYGICYLFSTSFKRNVEHEADRIALNKGFKQKLLKTKKYILMSDLFSEKYLRNMKKFYMSIEDVDQYIEEHKEVKLSEMYHK